MARPAISSAIKRTVRQRCRFGCVICGLPVVHYDHIDDYAVVQEHTAENITLLCPTHHQDKTSKRLPRETVRKANANPYNGRRDFTTKHQIFFDGDHIRFNIGTNIFDSYLEDGKKFSAIIAGGDHFASFIKEDDALLLNLEIRDAVLNPILSIRNGEVLVSTGVQDITMEGLHLTMTPKFSIKPVKIHFLENGVNISSGFFYAHQRIVDVSPSHVLLIPFNIIMSESYSQSNETGVVF